MEMLSSNKFSEAITAFADHVTNKTMDSCSRWATKRRIMGPPFEGPYNFNTHPWCRGLHDSKAPYNVSMKSAQAGFTEVGINIAFYTIDIFRRNVLYVLPTLAAAYDFSDTRFSPALALSPYLKRLFSQTNNKNLKMSGTTALYIRGSRGDTNLKSIPCYCLILDELDEMEDTQIELALQRLRGQPDYKVWYISTPTIPGHGVSAQYEVSTQEHFVFKCPGCGRHDEFRFPESVQIAGEYYNDPRIAESRYKCTMCTKLYSQWEDPINPMIVHQDEKMAALQTTGDWAITNNKYSRNEQRGFKINQLYSATVAPKVVVNDHFKGLLYEHARQEFHRSVLGEAYVGETSQVSDQQIINAKRQYKNDDLIPNGKDKRLITMGIDTGQWNYVVVMEWFINEFTNDLNAVATGKVLYAGRFYQDEWGRGIPAQLMYKWMPKAVVVDADPFITEAKRFAKKFDGHVYLVRYRGRPGNTFTGDYDGDFGSNVHNADRTYWLDNALGRFHSNRIELPTDIPTEFCEHVKVLTREYDKDQWGNVVADYKNYNKPDHYGHALTYAEMALPHAAAIVTNKSIARFL